MVSEISISASLTVRMTPDRAKRDWRQRWERIEAELRDINEPHRSLMSGAAIRAARDRLFSFFVQTYHLKDSLKQEPDVDGAAVERAISSDSDLALLADLANLDKHGRLDRPPRSTAVPEIHEISGEQDGAGHEGWRLSVIVRHGGQTVDGVTHARRVVEAWRRHLNGWGLL